MTGMPWFMSCGSIYATLCQKWLLGLWKRNSALGHDPLGTYCTNLQVYYSIFGCREGISSQKKMSPWHLWRGTLPAGQFGPEGRWRETRVDYFPSFFRFTTKSNLKIFGEKIVHWNFFLPKYIKHNILHGGNSAIISFMPVDKVTACQSWSYCTLSNGHFYSKGPPDIFSTRDHQSSQLSHFNNHLHLQLDLFRTVLLKQCCNFVVTLFNCFF